MTNRKDTYSFVWVTYDLVTKLPMYSELLRFPNEAPGSAFNQTFSQCMYESLHLVDFKKDFKTERDRAYVFNAYEVINIFGVLTLLAGCRDGRV
jgi:hypothetical protein